MMLKNFMSVIYQVKEFLMPVEMPKLHCWA